MKKFGVNHTFVSFNTYSVHNIIQFHFLLMLNSGQQLGQGEETKRTHNRVCLAVSGLTTSRGGRSKIYDTHRNFFMVVLFLANRVSLARAKDLFINDRRN